MLDLLLAISAVVPSLLLMWFFHARDVFREPPAVLWRVFVWGVLIVFPVLAVALPMDLFLDPIRSPFLYGLLAAFLQAAIPEEAFKLLVVWRVAAPRSEFDEPMDGVVYGVAASLGFATLENLLYVGESGFSVAVMRAVTAVPSHGFLGAIMGYFVGRARFAAGPERRRWLWLAFVIPTLLHGAYDTPLLAGLRASQLELDAGPLVLGLVSIAPLVVIAEWIVALRLSRGLRLAQIRSRPETTLPRLVSHGRKASIFLILGGGLAAILGGLVTLLLLVFLGSGDPASEDLATGLATIALMGLTPLVGGLAVFGWGLKRLWDVDH